MFTATPVTVPAATNQITWPASVRHSLVVPGTLAAALLFGTPWRSPARRHVPGPQRVSRTALLVARMIGAGDRIARLPYVWGGGHGSFDSAGYDCSGSVSYVLHAAGLLSTPTDSTGLEAFGAPGPGRLVTIYANSGHAWMTIAGRRFDTIALQETGTRWSAAIPSSAAYVARHPVGM
jgi:cell wall-associated NlpC family hydrolase